MRESQLGHMSAFLVSIGAAVILFCAVLAANGFKGRVSTIGVDLGTTFSVVGINIDGKVHIVKDKAGKSIFPSIVSYLPGGEIVAAYEARERLSEHPLDTIFNSKRFIGRSLLDEQVQAYAKAHPFETTEVGDDISVYGRVGFRLSAAATGHPSVISPESVGTAVLKHLLSVTSDYLGYGGVNKAVLAVPAKFNAQQRAATGAAYKAAGLKVVRVMEEPTAAAVAYQLHKKSNVHHILVYDFGGGTLDVSILYVRKGSVEVYATDGDDNLGGSDLDMCMSDMLSKRIEQDSHSKGASIIATDSAVAQFGLRLGDVDYCTSSTIRVRAEQIKIFLSQHTSASFSCNLILPASVERNTSIETSTRAFEVSRKEFLSTCQPLFARGMLPVTRLLDELGMRKTDIDEIVLVGGTTRIPRVKELLRNYFDKELNDHIDPDVTVAYGAASVMD